MKNKTLTVILVIVVGFIWYKVFFRIKGNLEAESAEQVQLVQQKKAFLAVARDTFNLKADYRDPFGNTKFQSAVVNQAPDEHQQLSERIKPKEKEPTRWPTIKYYGQIRDRASNDPLGIISIDGFKHNMRKGEQVYDGILIRTIGRDSIVIRYKKETKTFWRN